MNARQNGAIDVLAVMDAVSSGIHYPEEGVISITHHELYAFLEARAAVAELIEVAERIASKYVFNEGTDEEMHEWREALARVGAP